MLSLRKQNLQKTWFNFQNFSISFSLNLQAKVFPFREIYVTHTFVCAANEIYFEVLKASLYICTYMCFNVELDVQICMFLWMWKLVSRFWVWNSFLSGFFYTQVHLSDLFLLKNQKKIWGSFTYDVHKKWDF